MSGRLFGLMIGRMMGQHFGPAGACLILGAVLCLAGVLMVFQIIVSPLLSSSAVYVREEDRRKWEQERAHIISIENNRCVVAYAGGDERLITTRAVLEGRSGNPRMGATTVHINYNPADPAQVSLRERDWKTFHNARIIERLEGGNYLIEYEHPDYYISVLPGKPQRLDRPGNKVTVYYQKDYPGSITRTLYNIDWQDIMTAGFPFLFGGGFIFMGMMINKKCKT